MLRGPFTFDAAAHRYAVGAVCVPGLHAVLRAGGHEEGGGWFTQEHQARGAAVHAATLTYDLTGDVLVLPAAWAGYLAAYVALRAALRCRWRWAEHPRVHRRLRYASILDRVGRVNGHPAVVELKTGYPAPWHGVQLAGADGLLPGPTGVRKRYGFYLGADGRFVVREYTSAGDYIKFHAALARYWEGREDGEAAS